MHKILGRHVTSGLYFKLSKMLEELQDWRSRKKSDPVEGLGAVYDSRKWMKNYYGKHTPG
jgi:hypothetical protein